MQPLRRRTMRSLLRCRCHADCRSSTQLNHAQRILNLLPRCRRSHCALSARGSQSCRNAVGVEQPVGSAIKPTRGGLYRHAQGDDDDEDGDGEEYQEAGAGGDGGDDGEGEDDDAGEVRALAAGSHCKLVAHHA